MISRRLFLLFFSYLLTVSAVSQNLTKLRFLPQWLPQAQFAGYYIALEKGYYKDFGLDVEIKTGGPLAPSVKEIKNKNCDIISMFLSGALKAQNNNINLVDFCQLSKKSALMFVSKKKSNITKPEDFNNKKIGIWRSDFRELPLEFLKKYNIDAELVPITNTLNLFYYDGIDIQCVMWYNEYHQLLNFGINPEELNTFFFNDYDFGVPEDALFCTENFYKKNSKACQNFAAATIKGWEYAFNHKEEAIELVIKYMHYANVPANYSHQKWMLERMQDIFILNNEKLNGILIKEDFYKTAKILLDSNKIKFIPEFNEFNKTK